MSAISQRALFFKAIFYGNHFCFSPIFDQDAEKVVKDVRQSLANGEGCMVYGVLHVQRVAGNFHISVHGLNIFIAQQPYLPLLKPKSCFRDLIGSLRRRKRVGITFLRKVLAH